MTFWLRSQAATGNWISITGDDLGRFEAEEAPRGEIVIESRAAPWISIRGIRIESRKEREVEIPIGLGRGSLAGLVTDAIFRPIAGARLTLTWFQARSEIQSTVYREAVSDAQGRFRFTGIAPGQAAFNAAARGFRDRSVRRELTGGDEEIRIELAPLGK
jgi:hypothetical protein